MYSNLMMEGMSFSTIHVLEPCVRMVQGGGGVQLPDATRSTQVPRPHQPLAPLSSASRLCLVAPRRRCACMLTRCHTAFQTHVTTIRRVLSASPASPGYFAGLFTTGSRIIPRPGALKGGGGEGCFGQATARLGSTFSGSGASNSNSKIASR